MSATTVASPPNSTIEAIKEKAKRLSVLSMMATTAAGSGHPTSCMSAAELVAGTFFYAMKFDPKNPNSHQSDRFVLSKGHAAPVLYAALAEAGVFPESRLMTLRQFNSELEGHPTPRIPGVDAATGSLGQGLSVGAGLAIAQRMDKTGTRVYVLLGDGEMAEGQIWEAAEFAGHYKLDNLTVLADVNALGQSEPTMYQHDMEVYRKKFEAEGFATEVIDGHDVAAVLAALDRAKATKGQPQAIIARTIKGHGVDFVAGKEHWHGKALSKDELAKALQEIGLTINVPPDPGKSYARTSLPQPPDFPAPAAPDYAAGKTVATREAYGFALKRLGAVNPNIVAISGDVKNSTFSEIFGDAFPDHFIQGYIAEQNLVSVAVGLAAFGKVPFADTFACFLSRAFDEVRMAAISRSNINLCGSHCGVSIGEDGPSQMALEDIAAFRAVHSSTVLYPSDAMSAERLTETMARRSGINYLRTSRPKTPILYSKEEKFPIPGFKVLRQSAQDKVTVIGAGITLHEALKAADELKGKGTAIRVIDLYCVKPIDGKALAEHVKATAGKLVTVEDHWPEGGVGEAVLSALASAGVAPAKSKLLAVNGMPHSGKPEELVDAFGISARHIVEAVNSIA
ncbi:MAG TPA: transketolase [Candidatus Acidoferrales bacterium]|jgi:transketolase|nr:transketolase [Candidatus Acidoferrales bacterium]